MDETQTATDAVVPSTAGEFVAVIGRAQTYRNLAYLLLSFPLGLAYFVFLTVGVSLGVGLSVVLVGIPILLGVLAAVFLLADLERALASGLLGVTVPTRPRPQPEGSLLDRTQARLSDSGTWQTVAFLLSRFVTGLFAFVVTVTLLSLSFALLAAPLVYDRSGVAYDLVVLSVESLPTALLASGLGLVVLVASLHVFTLVAGGMGRLAVRLLSPRAVDGRPGDARDATHGDR